MNQPASIHGHKDIEDVTHKLFDKMAVFAILFGAIATFGSFTRIFRFGWNPNVIVDLTTYGLVVLLFFLRKWIGSRKIAALFLITLIGNGCFTFFLSGLVNVNLTLIATTCVVTGALFGIRKGIFALLISLTLIIVAATLFTTGHLHSIYDLTRYLQTPQAWISQISGFFVYALASLAVIHFIQKELWSSVQKLKQRSHELHESEKKYRLLTDNMRDVLLLLDTEFTITYINPSCKTLFDYTPEELLKQPIMVLCPETQQKKLRRKLLHCLNRSDPRECSAFEWRLQRKNNSLIFVEFTPTVLRDTEGTLLGIQAIIRDITDKKQAEEEKLLLEQQLRQSEKLEVIGQLAGGIAHDFNNQLAGILGFAEIIKADSTKESEVWMSAQSIATITRRAGDLTGKLLAFARKGNYVLSIVDIHAMIQEISSILQHSINPDITIKQQLKAQHFYVQGDAGQLQNALLNIALNARDAMPDGGFLQFSTVNSTIGKYFTTRFQSRITPGRYLHTSITDTGTGIPEEVIRKIFEPFFTTKDTGKGTGMGLAAVYGTIQAHHGIIDVVSSVSAGTTFHIYLPYCTDQQPEEPATKSEIITSGTGTILLVEDEDNVSKMMKMVIKKLGYEIERFADGGSAVERFKEQPRRFNAVILDLVLPGINGKETFRHLRQIVPDIPILIYSGYSADKDVQHLLNDRRTFFIRKPFTMSELSSQISILLAEKNKS